MAWFRKGSNEPLKPTAPHAPQADVPQEPQVVVPANPAPANPEPAPPEWDATLVGELVWTIAPDFDGRPADAALLEAQLADAFRNEQLEPCPTDHFARLIAELDEPTMRRLAIIVRLLDVRAVRSVLPTLARRKPAEQLVRDGLVTAARETEALTLELLDQSEVRAEEFARHLAFHLGVGFEGETAEVSAAKRRFLDYRRLLAEAQRARESAEEQMEYLRKLQEAQDAGRKRGKW